MMRASRPFLTLAAVALLGGCAALSGKHGSFTVYAPRLAAPAAAANATPVDWQLVVETPRTSAALDTPRITVAPTPGVLEVYPEARWRDPVPQLLRSLVVQAFDDSGRLGGVSGGDGLSAEYSLAIEVRDFQAELDGGTARAAIRFNAKLFDHRANRIVATRAFEATSPAASSDVASVVPAFETALGEVLPSLVAWTLAEGSRHQGAKTVD